MSTTRNATGPAMTASFMVLLALAVLLWLATAVNAFTIRSSDAAGNALSHAFGVLIAIALFVILAIVVILTAVRGNMPMWMRVAALVLVPASCAATIAAIELSSQATEWPVRWPLAIPVLAPALIIVIALWSFVPSLRAMAAPSVVGGIAWGALAVLSIAPWPALRERAQIRRAGPGELQAIRAAKRSGSGARERDGDRAEFEALEADAPLHAWLPFTEPGHPLRDRALAAIRNSPNRQTEAEEMVRVGNVAALRELPHFAVEATPALCEAAVEAVTFHARRERPNGAGGAYAAAARDVEFYMPAIEWLAARGCNLDAALAELDTTARAYADSPERQRFIERLVTLRRASRR